MGQRVRIVPDCDTCVKKEECERALSGTFCPSWQSKEPAPKGEDPNEQWRRGEESPFD